MAHSQLNIRPHDKSRAALYSDFPLLRVIVQSLLDSEKKATSYGLEDPKYFHLSQKRLR